MNLLPTELCLRILSDLPCTEDGVRSLARCGMTGNSALRFASMDSKLWKAHYQNRYRHAERGKENARRNRLGEDWRRMYYERRRLDREALENLRIIEGSSPEARIEPARRIARLGLDAWNVLSEEAHLPLPPPFQEEDDIEKVKDGSPLTNLTRKYWASELKKIIARRIAIDKWTSLKRPFADVEVNPLPFEEAFATLSCFHGVLPDDIMDLVNREANWCKRYLEAENVPYVPGTKGFTTRRVCEAVCEYMRSQGFASAHPDRFYDIRNSLPHIFLTSARHCLPISLVFIFVTIVKSLELEASALNTPNVVVALVRDTLVDVRQMPREAPIAKRNDENDKKIFAMRYQMRVTVQLLARAARNIDAAAGPTPHRVLPDDRVQDDDYYTLLQARYLSHCLSTLMDSVPYDEASGRISSAVRSQFFPLDMELVILDKGLPSHSDSMQCAGRYYREDDDSRNVRALSGEESRVALQAAGFDDLFVGQIVSSGNYVPRAVVGWKKKDAEILCSTISSCHDIVKDFPVKSVTPRNCTVRDINSFQQNPILGQYFEDAEVNAWNHEITEARARFIMNKRLTNLYPDDDAQGGRWIRNET